MVGYVWCGGMCGAVAPGGAELVPLPATKAAGSITSIDRFRNEIAASYEASDPECCRNGSCIRLKDKQL